MTWSALVTSLSTLQVRAHFLLYREWAALLAGRTDINLADNPGRGSARLYVELTEFMAVLVQDNESGVGPLDALSHTIPGLVRVGLLDGMYTWGGKGPVRDSPHELALMVRPSDPGIELYGWALGKPGMSPGEFVRTASEPFAEVVPRLTSAVAPNLPPLHSPSEDDESDTITP